MSKKPLAYHLYDTIEETVVEFAKPQNLLGIILVSLQLRIVNKGLDIAVDKGKKLITKKIG